MNKPAITLSLVTLIVSILWLVFLIASMATAGPLDTFERVPGVAFFNNLAYFRGRSEQRLK
jgi:hypothetical protein